MREAMELTVQQLLIFHTFLVGMLLCISGVALKRKGLFKWTTAGFWAWSAFALYYGLSPLAAVITGELSYYQIALDVSGGMERGVWILLMALAGMGAFFIAYGRTRPAARAMGLLAGEQPLNLGMLSVMLAFLGLGFYSLLSFRAGLLNRPGEVIIEQGRFVGQVSGYEQVAYLFLIVPSLYLLYSSRLLQRLCGWGLAGGFVILSLPHGWARFITVSMLVAISIVITMRGERRKPPAVMILAVILAGATFQVRGHSEWTLSSSYAEFANDLTEVPERGLGILTGADTSMLPTWYVESYLKDTLTHYDYGLPLLNYLLTGWLPNRLFPGKYFLIDWLDRATGRGYPPIIDTLLYGAKSSLLGSFYAHGGWLAIVALAYLAGVLSRKLDGWVEISSPQLLQAVGTAWMSALWMVWGSSDTWAINLLGAMAIPGVALWLAAPKYRARGKARGVHGEMGATSQINGEIEGRLLEQR